VPTPRRASRRRRRRRDLQIAAQPCSTLVINRARPPRSSVGSLGTFGQQAGQGGWIDELTRGKLAFRWIYWNDLLPGRPIPLPALMSMAGKHVPETEPKQEA
jgi:hypothetical protein